MHDQALPYMIRHALVEEPLSESEIRICCEEAMAELNRRGYTNYMDAWLNFLEHLVEYVVHNTAIIFLFGSLIFLLQRLKFRYEFWCLFMRL